MADPTATARLDVISAAPVARNRQVLSRIRNVKSAPASGTA